MVKKTKISSVLWAPSNYLFTIQIKIRSAHLILASTLACTERGVVLALLNLLVNVSKAKILSASISSFKSNRNESNLLYFHLCHHFRPLDLLLQPPPNFHSTISFDLSDTWLSRSQGFSFGSIRSSSFARKSGLLKKRKI